MLTFFLKKKHLQHAPTFLTAFIPARAHSLRGPRLPDVPDAPDTPDTPDAPEVTDVPLVPLWMLPLRLKAGDMGSPCGDGRGLSGACRFSETGDPSDLLLFLFDNKEDIEDQGWRRGDL